VALHILCYRAEKVREATEEMDREHSRGCREKRMQHITNRRKVEGQDLIENASSPIVVPLHKRRTEVKKKKT